MSPPRSFGRPEPDGPEQVLVFPPVRLAGVQVPLELVLDPESLAALGAQIQQMVRTSVLAGLDEAMRQVADADDGVVGAADEGGRRDPVTVCAV